MSITDVALAARGAGFTGDALVTAVAISGAETGGTYAPDALADTRRFSAREPADNVRGYIWRDPRTGESLPIGVDPEYSVGAWQINLLVHLNFSYSQAVNLAEAAAFAFALSNGGTDFTPWSTYNGGEYQAHQRDAQKAVAYIMTFHPAPGADGSSVAADAVPPPLTENDLNVVYALLTGKIAEAGLPFTSELMDGRYTGESSEAWTLTIHGRPRP